MALSRKTTTMLALFLGLIACGYAEEKKAAAAIKEVKLAFNAASFKKLAAKSTVKTPLLIEDAKAAAEYFSADELKMLTGQFDFAVQKLVVFAWRGSGQNQLSFVVMESYPEQIRFQYQRGRTRDLRTHLKLFALRKNVSFSGPR